MKFKGKRGKMIDCIGDIVELESMKKSIAIVTTCDKNTIACVLPASVLLRWQCARLLDLIKKGNLYEYEAPKKLYYLIDGYGSIGNCIAFMSKGEIKRRVYDIREAGVFTLDEAKERCKKNKYKFEKHEKEKIDKMIVHHVEIF